MLTYRTGAAGAVGAAGSMASHLLEQTLPPEQAELAQYYQRGLATKSLDSNAAALSPIEQAAAQIVRGDIDRVGALDRLKAEATTSRMPDGGDGGRPLGKEGGPSASSPDSAPVGIALGREQEAFPSEPPPLPSPAAADAGGSSPPTPDRPLRYAELEAALDIAIDKARDGIFDGTVPEPRRDMNPLLAQKLAIDPNRPPTREEIAELLAGNRADGLAIPSAGHHQRYDNRAKISYIDLCWSADKNVSLAWAFAPTHAERNMIMQAHKDAVESAMHYVESEIGRARRGSAGSQGFEQGAIGWIAFDHYAARPTIEIARTDSNGAAYTDLVTLKVAGDPQLHTHVAVPNAVLTPGGHLGSLDLLGMEGRVHEFGAYYQAHLATNLRRAGIEVTLDERSGAARLPSISDEVRAAYSKRTRDAEGAARDYAAKLGIAWDDLDGDRKAGLLKTAAFQTRRSKETGAPGDDSSDFAAWTAQAKSLGWHHHSVIQADRGSPEPPRSERLEIAYAAALNFVERELDRRAVLDGCDLRVAATRGLVASGIEGPADIAALTRAMRERGVRQAGEATALIWGEDGVSEKGRPRTRITTALHERQEQAFVDIVQRLHAQRAHALTEGELIDAVERVNARRTERGEGKLDFSNEHGEKQFLLAQTLASGGDYALGIGVAGSGKSAVFEPLVEAYKEKGYDVVGTALAWRQTDDLAGAGIARRFALAKLLTAEQNGSLNLSAKTVIFVDEYGLIGTRNGLALAQIAEKYGCKIINTGDEKQCQSIKAGPLIDLARRALGPASVPELLSSIRQEQERERQTALLFREGEAKAALDIKREDGTAQAVPGGPRAMAAHVAALWEARQQANHDDPAFSLTISAPTNEDARILAQAIRDRKQAMGQVGPTLVTIAATDQNGAMFNLGLGVGDRVRLFDRVAVTESGRGGVKDHLGNNGTVVEVRGVDHAGVVLRSSKGTEGHVSWDKLRDPANGRIRLTYGDALSIDATQGVTSTEHINALPSGSRAINGFKAYVAESRHRRTTWLIVSDGAERGEIMGRRPIGDVRLIAAGDVWDNVARNLARQPVKSSALDFLDRARQVQRTAVRAMQGSLQPMEQRRASGRGGSRLHERFAQTRDGETARSVTRHVERTGAARGAALSRMKELAPSVVRAVSATVSKVRPAWEAAAHHFRDRFDRGRGGLER